MKQVRELLVTAKAAKGWSNQFNEKVEQLMVLVGKIDTDTQVMESVEIMDVYAKKKQRPSKSRRKKPLPREDRPFVFVVFRN